ncbi:MAG: hypothetical protein NVSMB24_26910 [Mucilaginibacter sp.]
MRAPTRPWVVEIGKPNFVANKTVNPVANAMANTKTIECMMLSGTSPLPEKFFISVSAKK